MATFHIVSSLTTRIYPQILHKGGKITDAARWWRQRQAGLYKYKVSLVYIVKFQHSQGYVRRPCLKQTKTRNNQQTNQPIKNPNRKHNTKTNPGLGSTATTARSAGRSVLILC